MTPGIARDESNGPIIMNETWLHMILSCIAAYIDF